MPEPHHLEVPVKPEQTRAVADAMTALWEREFPATVRVLSAVSDAGRDYRPDPRSRSAWELVTHLATADIWFIDSIAQGAFAFDPEATRQAQARFRDVSDVVGFYERTLPGKVAGLRGVPAEDLAGSMDLFGMMKMSRVQWIGYSCNHSIHHRGQLSAYLRALGSKVPDIYGPSGDAEPMHSGKA